MEFLTSVFNRIVESEKMPVEWRRSVLVPNKGNNADEPQNEAVRKSIVEAKPRKEVVI